MGKKDTPTIVDLSGYLEGVITVGGGGSSVGTLPTGDADTVDGFHASATAIANTILALNGDAKLPTSITGDADTVDGYDADELAALAEAETVTGLWTFSRSTNPPFACVSGAGKVVYLDADLLDGYEASAFPRKAEAAVITGGWTFQADIQLDADLDFVGAQSITTTADNLTISPAGDLVLDPAGDEVLPAVNYDINLGSITKKYLALHAAELWVQTLVAQDVVATIAGRVIVGPTTKLAADLAAFGTDLLTNGGFETAGAGGADVFSSWAENAGDGSIVDETAVVHVGSHAAKLTSGASSNTYIYQDRAVTAGKTYRVLFVARGDGTNAGRYQVYDATNSVTISGIVSTGVTGAAYASVSYTFVAPAGCSSIRIILYCPAVNAGYGYFDYVRMWESQISVEHNEMAVGDTIYMEADGKLEFMKILAGPSGSGPYMYGVERNRDGTGSNDWYAGDTIVNTGAAGDGVIDLYSVDGITGGGAGPTIVGWVRNSDTFNDMTERWAIGNLNGLYGVGASDVYGVGLGQYASGKSNVMVDATSGIRLRSYNTVKFQVQPDGDLFIGEDVSAPATTFLSVFTNAQTYNSESVAAGDVLIGDNTASKANIFWDKSEGRLKFRGGTSTELYIDTDGTLVGAGGAVKLNSDGLVITAPENSAYDENSLLFVDGSGNTVGSLSAYFVTGATGDNIVTLSAPEVSGMAGAVIVIAESPTATYANSYLRAKSGSVQGELNISAHSTYGAYVAMNCDLEIGDDAYVMGGLMLSSVGMGGSAPTAGCVHIPDGNLVGTTPANIADDTAISFSPANLFGSVLVTGRLGTYMQLSALVVYRAYTSPFALLLAGGTAAAVTTGALSGTTGADGKFTISAHTDGKIYLENRMGTTVSIHYVCFSG